MVAIDHDGIAVGVISTATGAKFGSVQKLGRGLVRSIKLTKPFVPKPGKSSGPWVNQLVGNVLHSYDTRSGLNSGTSSKTTITLCANGNFSRHFSSSGYSGPSWPDTVSVSYAGSSQYFGKWSVVGSRLHLFYNDGDKDNYELSTNEAGNFLMNGARWLKAPASCQ